MTFIGFLEIVSTRGNTQISGYRRELGMIFALTVAPHLQVVRQWTIFHSKPQNFHSISLYFFGFQEDSTSIAIEGSAVRRRLGSARDL